MDMVPAPDRSLPESPSAVSNEFSDSIDNYPDVSFGGKEVDHSDSFPQQGSPHSMELTPSVEPSTTDQGLSATTKPLLPYLVGKMSYEKGTVVCKGRWGMSPEAHSIPGQTSDFEFKLVQAEDASSHFPVNGVYQGWFSMRQAPSFKTSIKVEDKEMSMKFVPTADGGHEVNGNGHNKFGSFTLKGTLSAEGEVQMYREYYILKPVQQLPRRGKGEVKKADIKKEEVLQREGSGRIRRQSSLLKEFNDPTQRAPKVSTATAASSSSTPVAGAGVVKAITSPRVNVDRAHRLSASMRKCSDLLRELCKCPQSIWFLDPVDPIALNIPEYPSIIKNPMDFSTIKHNIESGQYESVDQFAQHMRLVFRNAIVFNQMRDNPVNIAAREMSEKFEARYRFLITQLSPEDHVSVSDSRGSSKSQTVGLKRSKAREVPAKMSRSSSSGKFNSTSFLPPAAMDGSTQKILEMQRMMESMADEIKQLRATVKGTETLKRVNETKEAALNPLSLEEKKALIAQINKLPTQKMDQVLDIIQKALPLSQGREDDGEIQVPLDSLDTLTLRKLQAFVEENVKKRPAPAFRRQSSKSEPGSKKAKRGRNGNQETAMNGEELAMFAEEDMLFTADSLKEDGQDSTHLMEEELAVREGVSKGQEAWLTADERKQSVDSHNDGLTSSGNDVEDEEEEVSNIWSVAAAELRAKRPNLEAFNQ